VFVGVRGDLLKYLRRLKDKPKVGELIFNFYIPLKLINRRSSNNH
jgi:hypothetical protein